MNLGLFNVPSSTLTSIKNENLNNGLTRINSNRALIKCMTATTIYIQIVLSILYAFIAWKPNTTDDVVTIAAKAENNKKCTFRLTKLTMLRNKNKIHIAKVAIVAIKM